MRTFASIAGISTICAFMALPCFGQAPGAPKETPEAAATRAAEAASKTAFYNAKAKQISDQLRSKLESENTAGLAELKKWIASDLKDGAKCLTANLGFMVWDKRYSPLLPELIDSIESAQKEPSFLAKLKVYKGYALMQEGKAEEGQKMVARAFVDHPNEAGTVAGTDIINGLKAAKRNTEVMELSYRLLIAKPDSTDLIDRMIKMRVSILNSSNKEKEALAELKRLFNACPMEKTGAVLTLMDQQIRLLHVGSNDNTMIERFHKEQLEGAASDGDPAVAPAANKEPSVMASIKVGNDGFDAAMESFSAETFQGAQQRCILMCLADKGDEALKWAKRAFGQANTPPQVKTATDLIARALKTQDGNIGRANAWVKSNSPKPGTPGAPAAK